MAEKETKEKKAPSKEKKPLTDQIDRAVNWVQSKRSETDPDGYYAALNEVTDENFDFRSADGQARMLTVMSMAALKAESGDPSALNDELRIADAYNEQGTILGRMLQARKIFRLMTPLGRQAVIRKMAKQITDEYAKNGKDVKLEISEGTLKAAAEAKTEKDFNRVRKAAAQEIADQLPANWKDRIRSLRMLSMLANPRTHIRNIVGNLGFMPVRLAKQGLKAVMERVVLGQAGQGSNRTTALLNPLSSADRALLNPLSSADRARIAAAREDYANVVLYILYN